jgi:hypothetical protein
MSAPSKVARRFAATHWRAALPLLFHPEETGDPDELDELTADCELTDSAGVAAVNEGLAGVDGERIEDEEEPGEGDSIPELPVVD